MGKSDLIEKINARVKSQMSSLTPRNAAKSGLGDKDDKGADLGEKRITSRSGTVIVRRRGAVRGEGEGDGVGPVALETAAAHPLEEPVVLVAQEPEPLEPAPREMPAQAAVETQPEVRVPEPVVEPAPVVVEAPVEVAPAVEVVAVPEPPVVVEPPVSRPPVESRPAPRFESRHDSRGESRSDPRVEHRHPPRAEVRSDERDAGASRDDNRGNQRRESRHDGPSGNVRGEDRTPPVVQQRPRSIEEVLAQEHGRVPQQRRAMVVGEGRPAMTRQEPARVVDRPEDQQARVIAPPPAGSPSAPAQPAQQGQGGQQAQGAQAPQGTGSSGGVPLARRSTPLSPTAVKEIANEERKKEKTIAKVAVGATPSRAPVRGPIEAEGIRPGKNVKKPMTKKREVVQRRDVTALESEPQFRKARRGMARKVEKQKTKLTIPKAIKRVIKIEETISVGELAHRMGVKATAIIKKLMGLGTMATINQAIDHDTASLLASEFGYEVENVAFNESEFLPELDDRKEDMVRRSPVVTIMGHVDHGKTTLLDAIRNADVASREAGGITQHIGAYSVETSGGRIVFLDTPGHEAFTAMRARGAQVTDIVVLVVAADDGVMPQTVEALNHAKAAKVPIIVAVNKIDKPGANPERIKQKLSEYELVPEEWGGQTIFAEVSAKAKLNIEGLLELILLQAEVLELEANPSKAARAIVIESKLDKGRGPLATVLVQNGTLRSGEVVVVGNQFGKVRAMIDDKGKVVKEAGPSTAVELLGLSDVPEAGDTLAVVEDLDTARAIAENRSSRAKEQEVVKSSKASLEDLLSSMGKAEVKELRIILKTDVQGSLEALQKTILDQSTDAVKTTVLHSGVGAISEGDVMLASASRAIIIGFNVKADGKSQSLAEQEGVEIKTYSVIYDAIDELKLAMAGMLKPIQKEKIIGHAEVRNIFTIPRIGVIAGSSVTDGKIVRSAGVRLNRAGKIVWEGKLASLKRFKDDVREVEKGFECGIGLDGFTDIRLGDVVEAYVVEEVRATL